MAKIDIFIKSKNKNSIPSYTFLNIWVSHGINKDTEGRIFISPELASDQEIDYCIDDLIKQLERVRKKAKKILIKNKLRV